MAQSPFAFLQKIGKSLMLPVAVLPVAGLLLGIGAANFGWMPEILSLLMKNSGDVIFANLPLIFAIGVALGFTENDGVSAIAAAIGYMVMLDGALNTFGWAIDLFASHTYMSRIFLPTWGNMFDAGYFWHYNELWVGSASGLGEKDAYPILRRDVGVQIPLPAVGATGRRRGQGHRPGRVGHPADAEIPPARIP